MPDAEKSIFHFRLSRIASASKPTHCSSVETVARAESIIAQRPSANRSWAAAAPSALLRSIDNPRSEPIGDATRAAIISPLASLVTSGGFSSELAGTVDADHGKLGQGSNGRGRGSGNGQG